MNFSQNGYNRFQIVQDSPKEQLSINSTDRIIIFKEKQKMKNNELVKKAGSLNSVQFFNALNKYIPSLVLQSWIEIQKLEQEAQDAEKRQNQRNRSTTDREQKETKVTMSKQILPYIQDMETVVLFADISGFTNISEACAKHGIRGNEELAFCINRYMEGMVKNLAKFGGDIIKFVGDAMIVMWPRNKRGNDEAEDDDDKVTVIRKAIQCAFDIQKELNNKKIMINVTNLSVKIGIAFGKCALLYVGGVFERSEFFTVGSALTYALKSEEQATEGGQIIVSDTAFKYVNSQYYEGIEIISEEGKKFYRVSKVIQGVGGRADAVILKSQIKFDRMAAIQKQLRSCVPAAIMPYLEIGYEGFGSETRALTVMFASLGVDLSLASSIEGMNKIQKIVTTVQQQVYRLEGSLNKLVMDDKGSTLICIWGLSPMAHTDDAQRAILTATNMRRELLKIEGTWCSVGIATGDVFSGVVGTSGSRKEFSVLGDVVNLAARIMFYPLKYKKLGEINCCFRTKNEAMNTISFKYGGHCEFKGKSISIPIFEPIDPLDEFGREKGISCFSYLKLHHNPMIAENEVNHQLNNQNFIGKQSFVNEIYERIKNYFFGANYGKPSQAFTNALSISISGQMGTGKTHLMRFICEKIFKDQDFVRKVSQMGKDTESMVRSKTNSSIVHQDPKHMKFPVLASFNNCDARMKFLGAWRPILRKFLELRRKYDDVSKDKIIRNLIMNHKDKVDIILEIFGVITCLEKDKETDKKEKARILKDMGNLEPQVENKSINSPIGFLLRQKFENHVTESLLDLIVKFIRECMGDEDEGYMSDNTFTSNEDISISDKNFQKMTLPKSSRKKNRKKDQSKLCILVFDQASIMEEESWSLLLRVYQECSNMVIITITDQDQKGNPMYPDPESLSKNKANGGRPYYNDDKKNHEIFKENSHVYDMPALNKKDLRRMLLGFNKSYQGSWLAEIKNKTDILDPGKSIKTVEKSQEWYDLLKNQFNLEKVYQEIDNTVIDIVIQKSNGIVIYALQFFFNLLTNGFLQIDKSGCVIETEKLTKCRLLQNYTKVPVPSLAIKKRLRNLDNYLKEGRSKGILRKQEIAVKGLMLLKTASIIGEEFGTAALKKIIPLRNETHGSILGFLRQLETAELIEILDESDLKNVHCRFNQSFLRESIYQTMLFRDQKQVLHSQLAEHLESLPCSIMSKNQIELEIERLKDHVLIGEDVTTYEDLPFKQKYGIIVKQMQQILIQGNNNIPLYKSWVFKQGKRGSKKISKRLLILTAREMMWFHNANEYENNKQPLGIIKVINIFQCFETLMQSDSFDFEVAVTSYIRKGIVENSVRNIKFGCETEDDRNHWISRVEFLKAKTVYDNYVNKFVNIQFPLKKEEDFQEDNEEDKNDAMFEKLHAFGKNFKQGARINHSAAFASLQGAFNHHGSTVLSIAQSRQAQSKNNMSRQSTLSTNSIARNFGFDDLKTVQNQSAKDLAGNLKKLYNAAIVGVIHHMTTTADKSQTISKSRKIGKTPDWFKPDWIQETNRSAEESAEIKEEYSHQRNIKKTNSKELKLQDKRAENDIINEQSEGSSSNGGRNRTTTHDDKVKRKRMSENVDISVGKLNKKKKGLKANQSVTEERHSNIILQQKLMMNQGPFEESERRFTFSKNKAGQQNASQISKNRPLPSQPLESKHMSNDRGQEKRERGFSNPRTEHLLSSGQMGILNQYPQNPLDGYSSLNDGGITEYNLRMTQDISPALQSEINAQVNLGIRQLLGQLGPGILQNNPNIKYPPQNYRNHLPSLDMSPMNYGEIGRKSSPRSNGNTLDFRESSNDYQMPITAYADIRNLKNSRNTVSQDFNFNSSLSRGITTRSFRKIDESRPMAKAGGSNMSDDEPLDPYEDLDVETPAQLKSAPPKRQHRKGASKT